MSRRDLHPQRSALIVGAGIAGLSSAVALRRAGWSVRIFERSSSPRELGFGLLVAPSAMAALRDLGLDSVVLSRSFTPIRGEARRLDGRLLRRGVMPGPEVLGGPLVVALRPALHGALLDAVGKDAIAVDRAAAGFTAIGDRVALHLSNGETVEGDLLVGADGVNSAIRRALHPNERPPRSSDIIAVRGAVHGAVRHMGDQSVIYYFDRGVEAFLARASDTGVYWALSLARELVPGAERDPRHILATMMPRLDDTFRAIAGATDDLRCDELFDRDPLPVWGTGRVTLVGDAAHPVLPHTGQGAAQAIVDAVSLGRTVADATDVAAALRAHEEDRREKTTALVAQGRRTARLMRSMNPVVCSVRDLAIQFVPIAPVLRVYARWTRRTGTF